MPQSTHNVRKGEPPLIAFVSSVIDPELQPARDCVERVLSDAPFLLPWLFEHTPASSQDVDRSYLEKVRCATFVFWLVGSKTTEPVKAEIQEALSAQRRLIVMLLPADKRDAETDALVKQGRPKAKYREPKSLDELAVEIDLAVSDEINRALQDLPGMSRVARLDELGRASRARCMERWEAAGVDTALALELAHDMSVGTAPELTLPNVDRPLRVLRGDIGAGKSLAGERFHQAAIAAQLACASAPVPVYVRARDAVGGLEAQVTTSAEGLGDPRQQGADVVIDGLDEAGTGVAADLLRQARVLARIWPSTRILITSRPLSVVEDSSELVDLPRLDRDQANGLVGRIAGFEVTVGREAGWPQNLRDAICLPLFAVLFGVYLRRSGGQMPMSRGELLRTLVEDGIGRVGENVRPVLRRLAVRSLGRQGGAVPEAEVATPLEVSHLEDTRLVVVRDRTIVFPLIVIAQWFAAESLAEGESPIQEIVEAAEQLENWRYPLAIVAGTYSYQQVTAILGPLATAHPGFASQVVEEGLAKWSNAEDVLPPGARECATQVRAATEYWVAGLKSLRSHVSPLRDDGTLSPLGAHVEGHWLTTGWYMGSERLPEVTDLPQGLFGFLIPHDPTLDGWVGVHGARPGRQAAWAWRWSFEQMRRRLERRIKRRELPLLDGPLADSHLWSVACSLLNLSFVHNEPVAIQPLLDAIPDDAQLVITSNGRRVATAGFVNALRQRVERGELELRSPFPGPDQPFGGGWIWDPWSEQALLARTSAVFDAALRGYQHLANNLFACLAPWMQIAVTLPARLNGHLRPADLTAGFAGGPTITWWLEALPTGKSIEIAIQLNSEDHRDVWFDEVREALTQARALRPGQSRWLDATMHNSVLEVFEPWAAEELVYGWLWEDLKRTSWVDGLLGGRPTGFGPIF